jgi:hypothetical protein
LRGADFVVPQQRAGGRFAALVGDVVGGFAAQLGEPGGADLAGQLGVAGLCCGQGGGGAGLFELGAARLLGEGVAPFVHEQIDAPDFVRCFARLDAIEQLGEFAGDVDAQGFGAIAVDITLCGHARAKNARHHVVGLGCAAGLRPA